jgi:hypothetical protein
MFLCGVAANGVLRLDKNLSNAISVGIALLVSAALGATMSSE